jgi:hypothetical protein
MSNMKYMNEGWGGLREYVESVASHWRHSWSHWLEGSVRKVVFSFPEAQRAFEGGG